MNQSIYVTTDKEHGYDLDFSMINVKEWVKACIDSINTGQEALKGPLF